MLALASTPDYLPMPRPRFFLKALTTKLTLLVATLLLAACAIAPVQEMSDARQAIRSAEMAGAAWRSPVSFVTSHRLLLEAQTHLQAGDYPRARQLAIDARNQAINAREKAIQPVPIRPVSP